MTPWPLLISAASLSWLLQPAHARRAVESMAAVVALEVAGFQCPDECWECCGAPEKRGAFKCVLKDKARAPPGRNCSKPKRRRYSRQQSSVLCDLTEAEAAAAADLGRCSTETRCCCKEQEDWTESLCIEGSDTPPIITRMSQKSNKMERYARLEQQYENKDDACKIPGNTPQTYMKTPRSEEEQTGCCIKSQKISRREQYVCGTITQRTGPSSASHRPRYCRRDVHWRKCVEWEMAWKCGGSQQTGTYFERLPAPGLCLGELSTAESLKRVYGDRARGVGPLLQDQCPAGYKDVLGTGRSCPCDEQCGQ